MIWGKNATEDPHKAGFLLRGSAHVCVYTRVCACGQGLWLQLLSWQHLP